LAVVETAATKAAHLLLRELQILVVGAVEHLEMLPHEQAAQAVQALSFFATPAQFNISLVAQ
jgi:hypothetical protein